MAARVAASRLSSRLTMMVNRNATLASRHITSCESTKRNTLFSLPVGHRDKTSLLALSAREKERKLVKMFEMIFNRLFKQCSSS